MGVRVGSWPPRDAAGYGLAVVGFVAFIGLTVFTGVQAGAVEADRRAAATAETVHALMQQSGPLIGYDALQSQATTSRVTLRSADTQVTVDRDRTRVTYEEAAWCVSVESHSGRIFQISDEESRAAPTVTHCN